MTPFPEPMALGVTLEVTPFFDPDTNTVSYTRRPNR